MAFQASWSGLKDRQARLQLPFDWVEETDYYRIVIAGAETAFFTILDKDGSADTLDFETNFKTDPQTFGNGSTSLQVTANIAAVSLDSIPVAIAEAPCPTLPGIKWRTEQSTSDVTLSTSSYTSLIDLSNGTLHSVVLDFSSDRVDVKFTIDGQEIFIVDLDDLEDNQTSGSSSAATNAGGAGIMYVKTGSKFCFNPPCGMKYSTLTISAKGESSNRKLSGYLIHYSVD